MHPEKTQAVMTKQSIIEVHTTVFVEAQSRGKKVAGQNLIALDNQKMEPPNSMVPRLSLF